MVSILSTPRHAPGEQDFRTVHRFRNLSLFQIVQPAGRLRRLGAVPGRPA